MIREDKVALTTTQSECLAALRDGARKSTEVAVKTKLTLPAVRRALRVLSALGLAGHKPPAEWHPTSFGETHLVGAAVRGRPRKIVTTPNANGRRLLELLEAPMEARTIAKLLGVSRHGALNIVLRLHVQGHLKFGDPEDPHWIVMRANDDTPLLSRAEARILSSIPSSYATNRVKIGRVVSLAEDEIEKALDRLNAAAFTEVVGEFAGATLYRTTAAGKSHPQNRGDRRDAEPPHLPVYSDRVQTVLSAISEAGAVRIKDLRDRLRVPHNSVNALMQYLKRKGLIEKTDKLYEAPYALTAMGQATLNRLTQRRAA